jgi:hypothetical protein
MRLLGLAVACSVALAPVAAAAQTITGRVLEDGRDAPVASALVTLLDRDGDRRAEAVSDSAGRFVLSPPQAGEYTISTTRLGYEPFRSPLLSLTVEGTVQMDLLVRPEPLGLEGFEVSVESQAVKVLKSFGHNPGDLRRRWIDRKTIESRRTAVRTEDVIRWQAIPGVAVATVGGSPMLAPLCVYSLRGGRTGCALTVLNGVIIDPVEANQLDPIMIEAIAVLSPMDAATLYGTQGGNGAVLIWLR